ncbi:MAG: protein kinase [Candidatus Schekmanbacteria bacterium]|nr:protein kinase [Candidatus Schekmanbacteria bacterium]
MTDTERLPDRLGPYRIVASVDRGGHGHVVRGAHVETGNTVAIKVLLCHSAVQRHRLRREVSALVRARHPGIVRILDLGLDEAVPWYAMELVEGATLRAAWPPAAAGGAPAGALTARERAAIGWLVDVALALAHVHGEGLIHGDLKPENVLIRGEGRAVLVDFGLTAGFETRDGGQIQTVETSVSGTIGYMAPEQIAGQPLDPRCDLYGLGCMLFELLTGSAPFAGIPERDRLLRARVSPPPAVGLVRQGLPAELATLVDQLVRPDREERPGYALRVATRLAPFATGIATSEGIAAPTRLYLYPPRFCGRAAELEVLRQWTRDWRSGQVRIGAVTGPSGCGKSRLVAEYLSRLCGEDIELVVDRCVPAGPISARAVPLQPMTELLERALSDGDGAGTVPQLAAAERAALARMRGQGRDAAPALGEAATGAELQRTVGGLFDALWKVVCGRARRRPLCWIVEDLHWADELTLAFLRYYLQRSTPPDPGLLLIVTVSRELAPAAVSELTGDARITGLTLGPLTATEMLDAAASMLAGDAELAALRADLVAAAGGNPLFLTQMLRALLDTPELELDACDRWRITGGGSPLAAASQLAEPLVALLNRRLAALPADMMAVLRTMALIGCEHTRALLSASAEIPELELWPLLHALVQRGLAADRGTESIALAHGMIADLVGRGVPVDEGRAIHRRIANAYHQRAAASGTTAQAAEGEHWRHAEVWSEAARAFLEAARAARNQYANDEAARCLEAYLSLPLAAPERAIGRLELATGALFAAGRLADAEKELREAGREAGDGAGGDLCLRARIARGLGDVLATSGRLAEARVAYQEALDFLPPTEQPRERAATLAQLLAVQYGRGELDDAEHTGQEALEMLRTCTASESLEARICSRLGAVMLAHGELDAAASLMRRAVELAEATADLERQGVAISNLAAVLLEQGNSADSRRHFQRALDLHRKSGLRGAEGETLGNLGLIAEQAGDVAAARDLYARSIEVLTAAGNRRAGAVMSYNLAMVEMSMGLCELADERASRALSTLRELGEPLYLGRVLIFLASAARRRTAPATEVARYLAEAEQLGRTIGNPLLLAMCEIERGYAALASAMSARPQMARARDLLAAGNGIGEYEEARALCGLERAERVRKLPSLLYAGEAVAELPAPLRKRLIRTGHISRWWRSRAAAERLLRPFRGRA